jgi:hypothetical protein
MAVQGAVTWPLNVTAAHISGGGSSGHAHAAASLRSAPSPIGVSASTAPKDVTTLRTMSSTGPCDSLRVLVRMGKDRNADAEQFAHKQGGARLARREVTFERAHSTQWLVVETNALVGQGAPARGQLVFRPSFLLLRSCRAPLDAHPSQKMVVTEAVLECLREAPF